MFSWTRRCRCGASRGCTGACRGVMIVPAFRRRLCCRSLPRRHVCPQFLLAFRAKLLRPALLVQTWSGERWVPTNPAHAFVWYPSPAEPQQVLSGGVVVAESALAYGLTLGFWHPAPQTISALLMSESPAAFADPQFATLGNAGDVVERWQAIAADCACRATCCRRWEPRCLGLWRRRVD